MSVETFNLTDTIKVTPAAADHFRLHLARSGGTAMRISLKESGCSGYMYVIEEISAPEPSDIRKTLDNGVEVFFAAKDAPAMRGAQIDYTRQGLNQMVKVDNPNVTDACGCGASFNLNSAGE
jgi:Fe-S cluster assembly protein SufA